VCGDEAPKEKQKPQVLTNKNLGQVGKVVDETSDDSFCPEFVTKKLENIRRA